MIITGETKMANYTVQGNKTVYCGNGHANTVPFQQTVCTCSVCGDKFMVKFFGVVIDKYDNYVY